MALELAIYAHPFDLRALERHGGLPRLRGLGFAEVALAASYHAGRWLMPWHPEGMVRFLEDGVVHFRPSRDYGRLVPQPSSEVRDGEPSPLERLCEQAPRAGLRARAWTVLTHNTRLGELHPDCCVENAFGDRHRYALCHNHPDVRAYIEALVRDIAAHRGLDAVELEALMPPGHRHRSHHDKSSFPTDRWSDRLLSTCFCTVCAAEMQRQGDLHRRLIAEATGRAVPPFDVRQVRAVAQQILRQHFGAGDAMAPRDLPEELLRQQGWSGVLLAYGGSAVAGALTAAQEGRDAGARKHGGRVELSLQTNWDDLHQGTAIGLEPELVRGCDEVAMTTYGLGPDKVAPAMPHLGRALRSDLVVEQGRPQGLAPLRPRLRLSFHPQAPQYRSDEDLQQLRRLCEECGIATVAVYHLGLLPWPTIERVARVFAG